MVTGTSEIVPHVYGQKTSELRTGYESIRGYVEYNETTHQLVEYGILASKKSCSI